MANEIQVTGISGLTIFYVANQPDGMIRTARTSLPEVGVTGQYKATDGSVVAGDIIILEVDGVIGAGGGIYQPGVNVQTISGTTQTANDNGADINAIKVKTDNLPNDPASETNVDASEAKIDIIQSEVGGLNGEAMRGTNGANTVVPDNASIDFIKTTTDKLDDTLEDDSGTYRFSENALEEAPTAEMDPTELANAMKAITGLTVGGTWTWEKIMKIATAFVAGDWKLNAAGTKQELLDAEDGSTVILEQDLTRSPAAGNKYRDITVKI